MRTLITGSTGHVGSHLTLSLLERGVDVVCIARSSSEQDASGRVFAALEQANGGRPLDPERHGRVTVIEHDLGQPMGATFVEWMSRFGIKTLWHCAATTDLNPRHGYTPDHINLRSSVYTAQLAERLGVERFLYVGTAYQCGLTAGPVPEMWSRVHPIGFRNAYEQSKWDCEGQLLQALGRRLVVFRPSIVLERTEAHAIHAWQGFYSYIRKAQKLIARAAPVPELEGSELGLLGTPDALLDLVYVDWVAEAMARIGLDERAHGVYHLTADEPTPLGTLRDEVRSLTGCHVRLGGNRPRPGRLSPILEAVAPYLENGPRFAHLRADALLRKLGVRRPERDAGRLGRHVALACAPPQPALRLLG